MPFLVGLAGGVVCGGLYYAARSYFMAEEESAVLTKTQKLAKKDFFRFRKNILHKLTTCPSIKLRVRDLESIYSTFLGLVNSNSSKGTISIEQMTEVYENVYLGCGSKNVEEKGSLQYCIQNMLKAYDRDADRNIDFAEVVIVLNDMIFNNPEQRVMKTFAQMGKSHLKPEDLSDMVDLSMPGISAKRKSMVLKMMQKLDKSRDGLISKKEWLGILDQLGFDLFNGPNEFEVALLDYFGVDCKTYE
eukprot:CAMPEP_0167779104 /NCGR_PEP_ID=MMETSP0111_2-20121227/4629_1 /TAXON_ID=91324 /ORGANISM="Lotharella globosa, Strain CCCM811" /LENGTH=245 /DNA_ID=CAMNT_0007669493 /DNA_START=38 /DNA_END=775 /DNA_ORIENTATION=-